MSSIKMGIVKVNFQFFWMCSNQLVRLFSMLQSVFAENGWNLSEFLLICLNVNLIAFCLSSASVNKCKQRSRSWSSCGCSWFPATSRTSCDLAAGCKGNIICTWSSFRWCTDCEKAIPRSWGMTLKCDVSCTWSAPSTCCRTELGVYIWQHYIFMH